jgi:hypothetical protein
MFLILFLHSAPVVFRPQVAFADAAADGSLRAGAALSPYSHIFTKCTHRSFVCVGRVPHQINGETVPANKCNAKSGEGCDEKQTKFIAKVAEKFGGDQGKLVAELARLQKQVGSKMKPSLAAWMSKRINVLTQLVAAGNDEL